MGGASIVGKEKPWEREIEKRAEVKKIRREGDEELGVMGIGLWGGGI